MDDCIFCKIVKGEVPSFKVYEDDRVYAFADINPISEGHTLIIPKAHAENLGEISDEDLVAIHRVSKKMYHAMQKTLGAGGIALVQANGRAVNQVVMHYHLHLIPRKDSQPRLAATQWDLVPGDMDTIKAVSAKIAAALGH
ncbi:MAG: HIT family protein [Deltaproteobacteria bacterium]|nr:HIT family protein [Deltaproteobacteria bacterium]MBW2613347.1 HIT family protein [Deltaproteobacteria bacterium]